MSRNKRIQEEISFYRDLENVHNLPPINDYWTYKYLLPKFQSLGFHDPNEFYRQYIEKSVAQSPGETCRILSIGAGNCDTEVALAESLIRTGVKDFKFTCMDINPYMLDRGRALTHERHLSARFHFAETDIKEWQADEKYQVILANHSLHHIVDLEILFQRIYQSLDDRGFFLTNDMIGRNGHMRWPEALEFVLALWSTLDERHKWNHAANELEPVYENWDSSREGFEGIRAQDILPLLIERFHFECFIGFNNLISVFIDRSFGPNFDPNNPRDCHFIDFVSGLDDYFIEVGKIKPTQMIAALVKFPVKKPRFYKHLTPEFCSRPPDLKQNHIYITDPHPYALKIGLIKRMRRRGFHKRVMPKSIRQAIRKLAGMIRKMRTV